MSNVTDFLKQIDEKVDNNVEVLVPSMDGSASWIFKQITVTQQKKIIKNTLEGIQGNIRLPRVYNSILRENNPNGHTLLIADRNAVLVQLRIASVGHGVLDEEGNETELDEEYIKQCIESPLVVGNKFEYKGIVVHLMTPTIEKDDTFFKLLEDRQFNTAGDLVNELYVTEAAKFLVKVEFNEIEIEPNPKESIELINKLPLTLNNMILSFVKSIKDYDNKFLVAMNGAQLTLNAKFFNTPD